MKPTSDFPPFIYKSLERMEKSIEYRQLKAAAFAREN